MRYNALGERMKKYEYVTRSHLTQRMPVIIRVDGKAFHTFTRGFKRPFDHVLMKAMQETMVRVCENIQGCVLGYTQSDEISFVLVDYKTLYTSAWFDSNIQKCASVAASMTTMHFNKAIKKQFNLYVAAQNKIDDDFQYILTLFKAIEKGAMFDARIFNLPKEEVANYFYWRQNDATRNSIQMVGQTYFSHSELQGKTCNEIQDMLFTKCNINWNEYSDALKRGSCAIKERRLGSTRSEWVLDKNIPVFINEGRDYIEKLIYVGE